MNNNYFSSSFTLGILGGGQLGKMLLTKTRQWDIRVHVMDPSAEAPARIDAHEFTQASLQDYEAVLAFGRKVDLITIEIENVNVEALEQLEREGKAVYPKPKALRTIQSKIRQKEFYREFGIPTAPFYSFQSKAEMLQRIEEHQIKAPFVWKAAEGGYDGRGVEIVRNMAQLENLPDAPGLLEDLVPFDRELAVIIARNPNGDSVAYPAVEMEFHPTANLVEYVFAPTEADHQMQERAREIALKVAESLDHVGLLAVELFVHGEHGVFVNEVAPRVHNSGHLSIEANICSQFEQHIRAILNLPLGSTKLRSPAAMINLNGAEGHSGKVYYQGMTRVLAMENVHVHWYGKSQTKPFRKMGHATVLADSLSAVKKLAAEVKERIQVIAQE